MENELNDFDSAFNEKLKHLSKEERARAVLKKLAQELEASKDSIVEPEGLASGATDKDGKMIIDLGGDCEDER